MDATDIPISQSMDLSLFFSTAPQTISAAESLPAAPDQFASSADLTGAPLGTLTTLNDGPHPIKSVSSFSHDHLPHTPIQSEQFAPEPILTVYHDLTRIKSEQISGTIDSDSQNLLPPQPKRRKTGSAPEHDQNVLDDSNEPELSPTYNLITPRRRKMSSISESSAMASVATTNKKARLEESLNQNMLQSITLLNKMIAQHGPIPVRLPQNPRSRFKKSAVPASCLDNRVIGLITGFTLGKKFFDLPKSIWPIIRVGENESVGANEAARRLFILSGLNPSKSKFRFQFMEIYVILDLENADRADPTWVSVRQLISSDVRLGRIALDPNAPMFISGKIEMTPEPIGANTTETEHEDDEIDPPEAPSAHSDGESAQSSTGIPKKQHGKFLLLTQLAADGFLRPSVSGRGTGASSASISGFASSELRKLIQGHSGMPPSIDSELLLVNHATNACWSAQLRQCRCNVFSVMTEIVNRTEISQLGFPRSPFDGDWINASLEAQRCVNHDESDYLLFSDSVVLSLPVAMSCPHLQQARTLLRACAGARWSLEEWIMFTMARCKHDKRIAAEAGPAAELVAKLDELISDLNLALTKASTYFAIRPTRIYCLEEQIAIVMQSLCDDGMTAQAAQLCSLWMTELDFQSKRSARCETCRVYFESGALVECLACGERAVTNTDHALELKLAGARIFAYLDPLAVSAISLHFKRKKNSVYNNTVVS